MIGLRGSEKEPHFDYLGKYETEKRSILSASLNAGSPSRQVTTTLGGLGCFCTLSTERSLYRGLLVPECHVIMLACTMQTTELPLWAIGGLYDSVERASKGTLYLFIM